MQEFPPRYGLKGRLARLFGVKLVSDIYEKVCDCGLRPPLDAKRKERLDRIAIAQALFIHVPKNAGTSVAMSLYSQPIKHASIRYYSTVAPELVAAVPSFAVVRDPVERFQSAYGYAVNGGGRASPVSTPFRAEYMSFRSPDDALDHVERATSAYEIDHIFRPQNWYLTDWRGNIAVDQLVMFDEIGRIAEIAPQLDLPALPHLNRGEPWAEPLTRAQTARLQRLYSRDFEVVEAARSRRAAPPLAAAS